MGRKSKFRDEFVEQVFKVCLLGATDDDLAAFFEVAVMTINDWKKAHPEFHEAMLAGKKHADANVGKSLYQRANGYSHPETKVFVHAGEVTEVQVIKHYPPDTTACIFWLKNRDARNWRDTKEVKVTSHEDALEALDILDGGGVAAEPERTRH